MKQGGNAKARAAFERANVQKLSAVDKYSSVPVKNYKNKLRHAVKDEMAKSAGTKSTSTAAKKSRDDEGGWDQPDFNDAQEEEDLDRRMGQLSIGSADENGQEDEPQFEIKSMKTKSSMRIGVAGSSKSVSHQKSKLSVKKSVGSPQKSSSKKDDVAASKKDEKVSDRWNDWDNDWDKEEDETDEDEGGNDWNNDWDANKKGTQAQQNSGESLVSKYGYQTRITEKNFVRNSPIHSGASGISGSDNSFQGYGSRGGFAAAVPRKTKSKYVVDSLQDIQDMDDLKNYAQERGLQIAQVSKEYGEVLKEKGIEYAADLSESVKNWWRSLAE
eukprot:CAMPEP_0117446166 /NCGR_PEP_ID=MMETSP0759-20121206/6187_1 /TAXON_ID=63605 /ORGANISM="Percolomonas cosmopolitus, Strain WS" /LENGTH=328 /DNA_ID=CAMNT_0005238397 /DNA_START=321 /DNA_END=1307 /DNA_ORIENTATION=+